MRFSFLSVAALVAVGPAMAETQADLIVKLRDPQAVGTTAARDAAAVRLSEQVGFKLQALSVTSGGELLLGIDREALAEELIGAARALPGVVGAEVLAGTAVVIETAVGTGAPDLAAIGTNLAIATGAPVTTRVQGGSVVVEAMPDELVDQAARRLQRVPEVTYAQPNLRLGIQPPDPPVMKPL